MFTIFSHGHDRNCEGVSRREFLRIGTLGGLTLSGLLAAKSRGAEASAAVKDKSVVVLFLAGGATHVETFDPKMSAPVEYRSMMGEVQTSIPGVTFGGTFPKLARLASKMAIVRSFRHGISSHEAATALVISGNNPTRSMLGSVYSQVAGTTSPRTGIPSNVLVGPAAVGEKYKNLADASYRGRLTPRGTLGAAFAPFDPSAGGEIKRNMELKIPQDRFDDRFTLLKALDRIRRDIDVGPDLDRFQQQAVDVILSGVSNAFDLEKEDPRLVARYDTSHIRIPADVLKKKRNTVPSFEPVALGKQMLLARRLCEAGCGFVTVTSSGWDMHGNAFGIDDGMPVLGHAVDHAVSAFLEDVEERGLSEKILLVITGDFGRTPKINAKAGRDHWGNLCTLAFAGGGLKMGQVIGSSDDKVSVPASDPVQTENLTATILHALFDPGILRLQPEAATINNFLARAEPIRQLF